MHELPVTEQIIKLAAARANGAKVRQINLVVGEYSGFIGDSIMMYFEIISRGTQAEGAELVIRYVKPQLLCEKCGQHFVRERFSFTCPHCGGQGVPSAIGKEFYIESIEVEA